MAEDGDSRLLAEAGGELELGGGEVVGRGFGFDGVEDGVGEGEGVDDGGGGCFGSAVGEEDELAVFGLDEVWA